MAGEITELGSGVGYLYITQEDGTTIISNLTNDKTGESVVRVDATTSAPLYGATSAIGTVTLTGAPDNFNSLTVNGVSIISGVIAPGGTLAATAILIRDDINSTVSVPDYTAQAEGAVVYIYPAAGLGSAVNGFAVVATCDAAMTVTTTDMAGGTDPTGIYDTGIGRRYFLNPNSTAVEGSLVGAVEITQYIVFRGLQTTLPYVHEEIYAGALLINRYSSVTISAVETEGGAGADDLRTIDVNNFNEGDVLILRGEDPTHIVTAQPFVGGGDNLLLANNVRWSSGDPQNCLSLQLVNVSGSYRWVELFRSPNLDLTVANLRARGIAQAVTGVTNTSLNLAGQTITLTPGTSTEIQRLTNGGVLAGNIVVNFAGTPMNGDHFWIDYRGTIDIGVFSIVIAGITLTSTQASLGGYLVYTYYNSGTATWISTIIKNTSGVDLVTSVQLATKEASLGNPATDGEVLQSTAAGVRSWTPMGRATVLENVTANNSTTAVVVEEILKTYTMSAGTFSNDNGIVNISALYQTAANANAKTLTLKWGATTLVSVTGNYNAQTILIEATINRIDVNNQSAVAKVFSGSAVLGLSLTTPAENLDVDFDIEVCATNGVASANDITSKLLTITLM